MAVILYVRSLCRVYFDSRSVPAWLLLTELALVPRNDVHEKKLRPWLWLDLVPEPASEVLTSLLKPAAEIFEASRDSEVGDNVDPRLLPSCLGFRSRVCPKIIAPFPVKSACTMSLGSFGSGAWLETGQETEPRC